jgi:glucose/arabinose dehydrogenase
MHLRMLAMASAVVLFPLQAGLAQTTTLPDTTVTPFLTGLSNPTGFRFATPSDLFVIEKGTGMVKYSNNGAAPSVALDLNVANNSERGLLGIEIDPDFANNKFVYLYYSATSSAADSSTWTENRLSRFTWDGTNLINETPLRVFGVNDPNQNNGANHNGGPLRFGPDGKLYGITGDLNRNRAEQNNTSLPTSSSDVGGIYRLETNGSPAAGNPFLADAVTSRHQWFAYGVRNSFGMAFDPVTGNLWDTENGPSFNDEINLVAPGFNSGWDTIMGPRDNPNDTTGLVMFPNAHYSNPEFTFANPIGITSIAFLANTVFDSTLHNGVLVGDINNGQLYLLQLNEDRDGFVLAGNLADLVADDTAERNSIRVGQGFGGVTEILPGPDGAIYIASYGAGTIYRMVPEPGTILPLVLSGLYLLRRRPVKKC